MCSGRDPRCPIVIPPLIDDAAEAIEAGIAAAEEVLQPHVGLLVVFDHDRAQAQVRVAGQRAPGLPPLSSLIASSRFKHVRRAVCRAICEVHQAAIGVADRRRPQALGELAAAGRGVEVVLHV